MPENKETEKKKTTKANRVKVNNDQVEILKEEGKTIIVRAKKGLSLEQFKLMSKMLESEKSKGYKIILLPYSVDSVEIK